MEVLKLKKYRAYFYTFFQSGLGGLFVALPHLEGPNFWRTISFMIGVMFLINAGTYLQKALDYQTEIWREEEKQG